MTKIIRASDAQERSTQSNGLCLIDLALPADDRTLIAVQRAILQPGSSSTPHYHDQTEVVVFLTGTVTLLYDGEEHRIEAGDTFIISAFTVHQVLNNGPEVSDALVCLPAHTATLFPNERDMRAESAAPQRRVNPLGGIRMRSTPASNQGYGE